MDPYGNFPPAFNNMPWAGGSIGPVAKLRLSFSAKGLRNRDVLSKSDPMLVVYGKTVEAVVIELGRTEVIANALDPEWVQELVIDYRFEEVQPLDFVIYDVDSDYKHKAPEKLDLQKQDYLGEARCILAEITASPHQVLTREIQGRSHEPTKTRGLLTIRAEEVAAAQSEEVEIVVRCSDLENQGFFSKSDPFLRISRSQPDSTLTPVFKTEEKKNNLNPTWKPIRISLQQLCNGDRNRPLVIDCFDFNSNGQHKLIGSARHSVNELLELALSRSSTTLMRQQKRGAMMSRGRLFVEQCTVSPVYSFLDYVFGGCEISFLVAVDFTASNGNPWLPGSLHYIDPTGRFNAYQTAIQAVGGVLQYYDSDKRFPCWGFGGKPDCRTVSHCFPLNPHTPEVQGIDGILAAYSQAVHTVELYGPTWFAPVVNMAASIAAQHQAQQKYFVLLIITDGAILDLQETVAAIVNASYLPVSLLIVGVGNADFAAMEFLDSDTKTLTTLQGRVAARDIVQFVPIQSVHQLDSVAKKLLKELPGQLLSYMKTNHVYPNKTRAAQ